MSSIDVDNPETYVYRIVRGPMGTLFNGVDINEVCRGTLPNIFRRKYLRLGVGSPAFQVQDPRTGGWLFWPDPRRFLLTPEQFRKALAEPMLHCNSDGTPRRTF